MNARAKTAATLAGCAQPEGFCLMLYRDEAGNEEWIWNSRDAVTPFCLHLQNGNDAMHVEWQRDRFDPWHTPKVGDRIFVNLTIERAREYRRIYVERWWDDATNGKPMRMQFASKEAAIEDLAQSDYQSFGAGTTPDVFVVTEEYLVQLRTTRPPKPRAQWFGGSGRFA